MVKAFGLLGLLLCFAGCGTNDPTSVGAAESEQAGQVEEPLAAGAAVLFVVGNTTLSAGDAALKTHLEGMGATVTVRAAPAAASADAQGKALILISESVTSTDVNTKFRDGTVPVICLEPALFDDFRMAGTVQNTDFGQTASQTELELTAVSHPLAAGLTVPISSTAGTFSWARPAPGAISIGRIVGTSDHLGIFAFDAGQALTSGVAPARRVGWVASGNLPTTLTKQGWQLFDDAVNWSTSGCSKTPIATACSGKSCGTVSDGCGGSYTCGTCAAPLTCGGSGSPNVCGCSKTSMATACSGKSCGTVADGCGGVYTCGTCAAPLTCGGSGSPNVCGCSKTPIATACSGKSCGTVADGCGGVYTCGTCAAPLTCGGSGSPNVCGCSKTPIATACSGKSCGTAADGCGGVYTCGTCAAPLTCGGSGSPNVCG